MWEKLELVRGWILAGASAISALKYERIHLIRLTIRFRMRTDPDDASKNVTSNCPGGP